MGDRYSASPEYLENFSTLIRYIYRVALGSDELNNDAVEREISAVIGKGKISSTMLGRYVKGEVKNELKPKTHLNIAKFLQARDNNPRWGDTDQDALTALYDWLEYGPEGAPPDAPADRHKGRPTAEKIKAANSKILKSLSDALPDMSTLEMLSAIEEMVEFIRYRIESEEDRASAPEPPTPECDENNPLCMFMQMNMQLKSPLAAEDVALVADKAGLGVERTRALLCGAEPTDEEMLRLATAAGMTLTRFRLFVESIAATIEAEKAQQAKS